MRFSSRVDVSEPNPIILAQRVAISKGIKLTKLNDSNPTVHGLSPECLNAKYTADSRGPVEVRRILANFINHRDNRVDQNIVNKKGSSAKVLNPDNLYVLSSTSQAYAWLMMLMCDCGDSVLAPTPGYPLIESIARLQGVKSIPYPLVYDGSWTIDIPRVKELLENTDNRIRALVLINPNNPTGFYIKPQERDALLQLCNKNNVAIIADEVFYDYCLEPFDGNSRLAGEESTLVFALDGFSKMLAAPHAKVGWIEVSGPSQDVQDAMKRLDVIADDFLPIGVTVSERIPELLQCAKEQTDLVQNRVRSNLKTLRKMLANYPNCCVSALRAEGGWNILIRVPSCLDDDDLALRLMQDYHLVSQPGYYFDMPNNGYLALSLLPEEKQFVYGVKALLDTVHTMLEELN